MKRRESPKGAMATDKQSVRGPPGSQTAQRRGGSAPERLPQGSGGPADQEASAAARDPSPAPSPELRELLRGDPDDIRKIRYADHPNPHRVLGPHPASLHGQHGLLVRAYHPEAEQAWVLTAAGEALQMGPVDAGVFAVFLPGHSLPLGYRLMFRLHDERVEQLADPYRFGPTITAGDLKWFEAGEHQRLWEMLGAHPQSVQGTAGTRFAVWAPHARRVSVLGEFCDWDGRRLPMRALGSSGVWELFVPAVGLGSEYAFEIKTDQCALLRKTDPFALEAGAPPDRAAQVAQSAHVWNDADWMQQRSTRQPDREPMAVYELHAGSWRQAEGAEDRHLSFRELAPRLVDHATRFGFTHVELLPVAEHAFYGSWGYQVTGHFAPTARYGSPDDLRYLVDYCHQHGLAVILDWVPAHFPQDAAGLKRFDGTPLFEAGPGGQASTTEWGTYRFDYSRPQVRNYLIANAVYWATEFHVDGLRVDAVASMLGYPYAAASEVADTKSAQRIAAESFLRELNAVLGQAAPGVITIAEDSTPTAGMTQAIAEGGLGFTFKWNLGWMHDTLSHFARPPEQRGLHTRELTFSMLYEHGERFVNALSHDEVVHGKRSLLEKMPGSLEERLANLRLLLAYQYTRPGKKLLFMGTELAAEGEWDHDGQLDWRLGDDPRRQLLELYLAELGRVYRERPALWRSDPDPGAFEWLSDAEQGPAVLAYLRRDRGDHVVVVLNLGAEHLEKYRVGVPGAPRYYVRLSTADPAFGGAGGASGGELACEPWPAQGRACSVCLELPPLAGLILVPA